MMKKAMHKVREQLLWFGRITGFESFGDFLKQAFILAWKGATTVSLFLLAYLFVDANMIAGYELGFDHYLSVALFGVQVWGMLIVMFVFVAFMGLALWVFLMLGLAPLFWHLTHHVFGRKPPSHP